MSGLGNQGPFDTKKFLELLKRRDNNNDDDRQLLPLLPWGGLKGTLDKQKVSPKK